MKTKLLILLTAFTMIGCASNSNTYADLANKDNNNFTMMSSDVAQNGQESIEDEPSIKITVAAQTLDEWPYEKAKLTYKLVNKTKENVSQDNQLDKNLNSWQDVTKEGVVDSMTKKGLTLVEGSRSKLLITFRVNPPTNKAEDSDVIFDDLGLTAGSTSKGTEGSIDVTIRDVRTNRIIWVGAVSGDVTKPVKTKNAQKRVIYSLLDSLFNKLPVAK